MEKKIKIGLITLFIGIIVIGGYFILSNQLKISKEEFGIYLLENDELVISDRDIISYNKSSHEIKLTEEGVRKIKTLDLYHKLFTIKLNGKEIYNGSFWTGLSSLSYPGIVIMDVSRIQDSIVIEAGYPSQEFFEGMDPRNNSEIFDYFQKVGKLIQWEN